MYVYVRVRVRVDQVLLTVATTGLYAGTYTRNLTVSTNVETKSVTFV